MMRCVRWFWLLVATVALAGSVYGQGVTGGLIVGSTSGGGVDSVQGAPFSADVVTEMTRMLPDGNRIHQETHGKRYRDSQGRTRTETEFPVPRSDSEQLRHVVIMDPVQRTITFLDPRTKAASVHSFPQLSSDSKPVPVTRMPAVQLHRRTPPTSEQLGTKDIEGLTVVGTRTMRTMEAGEIGNEKPLVSTHETWYSPDLHEAIESTADDPQWGHTTTRLTNIQRAEPDPALFQVPADYQIKEENRN